MDTKLEKNEELNIQIKKFWVPFIFIILCLINISIIPQLLQLSENEKNLKLKTKIKKYHQKEKIVNEDLSFMNVNILHEKKSHSSKKKEKEKIKSENESNHYTKTIIYIIVLISFILFFVIFIAKSTLQNSIPISNSDPRIDGYINLPETIETYKLIS